MSEGVLAARFEATPAAFRPWMHGPDPVGPETLAGAGVEELRAGMAGEGEHRGAFRLLAADGMLTWACDLALDEPDPRAVLRTILETVTG